MLRNWLETVIERLFSRMVGLVAAKLDARMEVELAAVHADLLKEAERYRSEFGEDSAAINERLELVAGGLGRDFEMPLALLPSPESKPAKKTVTKGSDATEETKRGRGRPRKLPQPAALPIASAEVQR